MKTFLDNDLIYIGGNNSTVWLTTLAKLFIIEYDYQVIVLNLNSTYYHKNVKFLNFTTLNHIYSFRKTIIKDKTILIINNFDKYKKQNDSIPILVLLPQLFHKVIYNSSYYYGYKIYTDNEFIIDGKKKIHEESLSRFIKFSIFL